MQPGNSLLYAMDIPNWIYEACIDVWNIVVMGNFIGKLKGLNAIYIMMPFLQHLPTVFNSCPSERCQGPSWTLCSGDGGPMTLIYHGIKLKTCVIADYTCDVSKVMWLITLQIVKLACLNRSHKFLLRRLQDATLETHTEMISETSKTVLMRVCQGLLSEHAWVMK